MVYCDNLLSSKNHSLTSLSIDDFVCHYHDVTARNDCDSSCSCYISQFNFTTLVDCSSRNLTFFPKMWPRQARVISLNGNLIEKVEKGIFTDNNSVKLENLYLHDNKINVIEKGSFQKPFWLTTLQLHRNYLRTINLAIFDDLPSLKNLTLYDNPWECDCKFAPEFKKFIISKSNIIFRRFRIHCTNIGFTETEINRLINRSDGADSDPESLYKKPLVEIDFSFCKDEVIKHSIVVPVTLSVLFVVMCSVGILAYMNRLLIIVWIYNKFGACFRHEDDDNEAKPYDVFIAHTAEDWKFVVTEILPELEETEPSYKVRKFTMQKKADFLLMNYVWMTKLVVYFHSIF